MKTLILTRLKQLGTLLVWLIPLIIVGFWLLANPQKTLALAAFVREHSMILMAMRWAFYAGVIWAWPTIAWHVVGSSDQLSQEEARTQYQKVLAWRWQIARLLVVYELVFPLNILATLGDWL